MSQERLYKQKSRQMPASLANSKNEGEGNKRRRSSLNNNMDLYEMSASSNDEDELDRYNNKMKKLLANEKDEFIYRGPKKALEMLSHDQLELLQTTALDSSQASVYRSLEIGAKQSASKV